MAAFGCVKNLFLHSSSYTLKCKRDFYWYTLMKNVSFSFLPSSLLPSFQHEHSKHDHTLDTMKRQLHTDDTCEPTPVVAVIVVLCSFMYQSRNWEINSIVFNGYVCGCEVACMYIMYPRGDKISWQAEWALLVVRLVRDFHICSGRCILVPYIPVYCTEVLCMYICTKYEFCVLCVL